jgi:uncharacterized protein GlcG (DUF336 family)
VKTKPVLSVDDVKKIVDAAEAHARANNWAVTVAVVDDGGHLLGMLRLDGAAPITAEMAIGKARTAALGRRETKSYEDIIKQGRTAFLSAPVSAMVEGGVPIVVEAEVVGAVGISGVKSEQDTSIARAGIAALGL